MLSPCPESSVMSETSSTPPSPFIPYQSGQHRRRISIPATQDKNKPSVHVHDIFPASPPATPVKVMSQSQVQSQANPPQHSYYDLGRRQSVFQHAQKNSKDEKHHRRTSTASIIRMAASSSYRNHMPILTPSKVLTLFCIVFSATYLASFIPMPRPLMFSGPTYSIPSSTRLAALRAERQVYGNYEIPKHPSVLKAEAIERFGDGSQRRERVNAQAQGYPMPPHLATPELRRVNVNGENIDGSPVVIGPDRADIAHTHPEWLKQGQRPLRRKKPARISVEDEYQLDGERGKTTWRQKGKAIPEDVELVGDVPTRGPDRESNSDFKPDGKAADPQRERGDIGSGWAGAVGGGGVGAGKNRKAMQDRMRKIQVAKQAEARIGVPVDSSVPTVNTDDRVIVKAKAHDPKHKVLKNPIKNIEELRPAPIPQGRRVVDQKASDLVETEDDESAAELDIESEIVQSETVASSSSKQLADVDDVDAEKYVYLDAFAEKEDRVTVDDSDWNLSDDSNNDEGDE